MLLLPKLIEPMQKEHRLQGTFGKASCIGMHFQVGPRYTWSFRSHKQGFIPKVRGKLQDGTVKMNSSNMEIFIQPFCQYSQTPTNI